MLQKNSSDVKPHLNGFKKIFTIHIEYNICPRKNLHTHIPLKIAFAGLAVLEPTIKAYVALPDA